MVSNCCGAHPKGNGDSDSSDIGICPECLEHCEYITKEEWEKSFDHSEDKDNDN